MQPTPLRVFVTGASGFIGRRLVASLVDCGYKVVVMVRPETANDSRIPSACEQIPVALTNSEKLAEIVAECDAVIYCAGSVKGRNIKDFSEANIDGVHAMLTALKSLSKPPKLLLLSSLAATRPEISNYAMSKHQGEQLLQAQPEIPWSIIQPPAVYGPGDTEMLPVLKMARRGLLAHAGPRQQRLSFIHVDDLVNAIAAWLVSNDQCLHKTYAIDDGRANGYDWVEIGSLLGGSTCRTFKLPLALLQAVAGINLFAAKAIGYKPMLTPGKVQELIQPSWLCDNREYSLATGWKPDIDLPTGVQQLFENMQ